MNTPTLERLRELEAEGLITLRPNSAADLLIANYTAKVQYERLWTDELMQLRGLIVDMKGNAVARPFKKFFNIEEHDEVPDEPFTSHTKLDGSLGICYCWSGDWNMATRGAFSSVQAQEGYKMLNSYDQCLFNEMDPEYTYLFEIIYPENRIVVDYNGESALVLLAKIHVRTGKEVRISPPDWPHRATEVKHTLEELKQMKSINQEEEGYVLKFNSGLRMKVKFDEYVRLHKIVTGVSSRTVWEYLRDGKDFKELTERVPDEFYNWLMAQREEQEAAFHLLVRNAKDTFNRAPETESRKDFALWAKEQDNPSLLFQLLDDKDIEPLVWKMLKPERTLPYAGAQP